MVTPDTREWVARLFELIEQRDELGRKLDELRNRHQRCVDVLRQIAFMLDGSDETVRRLREVLEAEPIT